MAEPTDERTATDGQRVCVFTTAHDATDSRVVSREIRSLDEAGYDVTYYTPFEGDGPVDVVSYGSAEEGSMLSLRERFAAAATVAAALYDTDYDVFHFHDAEALPVGVFLGAVTDASVVYDVHENVEDTLRHKPIFPKPLRPIVSRVSSVAELALSRFVDELIAASPDIAERFAGRDDLTVVTNYPQRRWAEGTDPVEHVVPDDDGPTELVYRGLLSENRGVGTLIDAVERIPDSYDVTLSIGGKYESEEDERAIQPRIDASPRIEFVEWFPTLADVIDHFRGADVGMMCFQPDPNKTDAVHRSNKLFQYMSAGLPIVVSDIGNWGRLVEDVDCGVPVDPEDPDAIADAVVELLEDPERRERFGRNGHRAALDRYNWESQRENLLSVYDRLDVERDVPDERSSGETPGDRVDAVRRGNVPDGDSSSQPVTAVDGGTTPDEDSA